jgi:hypothetical protein
MKAGENGIPRQDLFDAVDARMRRTGWDDMRWWRELERRPRDLAPDPHSVEAMTIRQGWFHGRAAAPAAQEGNMAKRTATETPADKFTAGPINDVALARHVAEIERLQGDRAMRRIVAERRLALPD